MKKVYQRPYLLSSHWLTNSYVSIIIIVLTKSCIKWNPSPYVVIRKPPKPRTKCKIHFCMRKETLNKEKKTCKKLKSTFWQRTKKTFCQKDMRSSFLMMCFGGSRSTNHTVIQVLIIQFLKVEPWTMYDKNSQKSNSSNILCNLMLSCTINFISKNFSTTTKTTMFKLSKRALI